MIGFIFWGLIAITLLVFVHELGHLLAAKLSGVEVEKFSIGFGPKIFKKEINQTEYSLSFIPLGGYVKLKGEDFEEEGFYTLPLSKKVKVCLSGPIFNLLFGFLIGIVLFSVYGKETIAPVVKTRPGSPAHKAGLSTGDRILKVHRDSIENYSKFLGLLSDNRGKEVEIILSRRDERIEVKWKVPRDSFGIEPLISPIVGRIKQQGPADRAGIKPGDEIISINGEAISSWGDLVENIRGSSDTLLIEWLHQGKNKEAKILPKRIWGPNRKEKIPQIGIIVHIPKRRLGFIKAIAHSAGQTSWIIVRTLSMFYKLIVGKVSRRALGGPILIAQLSRESMSWGMEYFLSLLAIISLNLFIINLLPIPALDGGRVLIFLIEKVRGRNFSKKEWGIAIQLGWLVLLFIIVFATFNDIVRLIRR